MHCHDSRRSSLRSANRVVVKVGSRAIIDGNAPGAGRFQQLAEQITECARANLQIILVSSGAVAMGCRTLGLKERPSTMSDLQAVAAIGQPRLMAAYAAEFAKHRVDVAQVLLTHADVSSRAGYLRVRAVVDRLLERGCVPIINENDTIATEELGFSDNDQLAAMVAPLLGAELLVLLTDVNGVLDAARQRIRCVDGSQDLQSLLWKADPSLGRGGMASKVTAAAHAAKAGVPVVIAPAHDPRILRQVVHGDDVGTLFMPGANTLGKRKHWIGYTLKARGWLVVDEGASRALLVGNSSLLPVGVVAVNGAFQAGDAVGIVANNGQEFARGLARYGSSEVKQLLGARSVEITTRLGYSNGEEVVHRDDIVLL